MSHSNNTHSPRVSTTNRTEGWEIHLRSHVNSTETRVAYDCTLNVQRAHVAQDRQTGSAVRGREQPAAIRRDNAGPPPAIHLRSHVNSTETGFSYVQRAHVAQDRQTGSAVRGRDQPAAIPRDNAGPPPAYDATPTTQVVPPASQAAIEATSVATVDNQTESVTRGGNQIERVATDNNQIESRTGDASPNRNSSDHPTEAERELVRRVLRQVTQPGVVSRYHEFQQVISDELGVPREGEPGADEAMWARLLRFRNQIIREQNMQAERMVFRAMEARRMVAREVRLRREAEQERQLDEWARSGILALPMIRETVREVEESGPAGAVEESGGPEGVVEESGPAGTAEESVPAEACSSRFTDHLERQSTEAAMPSPAIQRMPDIEMGPIAEESEWEEVEEVNGVNNGAERPSKRARR